MKVESDFSSLCYFCIEKRERGAIFTVKILDVEMASVDVNQVVAGIESGSIPEGVGLTALLMQSREQPTQLANHVPILTKRLLDQSKRSDVQSPVLEILAQLLVSPHAEEVAQVLIEDEILSQLLLFLNNNEFGIRYPLLRICISIAKLKRSSLQR